MFAGIELAQSIVKEEFEGIVDKGGNAYIGHVFRVYANMDTEEAAIVALLHDIVEDTDVTLEDLAAMGYSTQIISAIDAITRREKESYMNFIRRIKKNKLASIVKKADLKDNMNIKRIPNPTKEDFDRIKKYEKAFRLLTEGETEYV